LNPGSPWYLFAIAISLVLRQQPALAEGKPAHPVMSGAKDCQFAVPEGWSRFKLKWEGECADGKAHGKGALKALEKARVDRIFFGSMEKGELKVGVMDTTDGFIAGRFEHGRVVDTDDRSIILESFDAASAAAKAVSDRFNRSGNAASARFYDAKAKKLAEQMD
jgi:hypothetical protein